ncbi:hypothetical protein I532_04120 [Brevibacillus borstelensis AK1]|uniref:Uncharacterized protein n=1 Tax=Brevibacillus borstelensis AK1 TaxID=1300222 RepID=M8DMQ3_9BACL|nr:sigma-70 family RNA polymerase sigma factor [Brevibacillus borstelensis]EMT54762.1 hypothetical protein I532_04120 [Brevibacillus borstelensis AK1]
MNIHVPLIRKYQRTKCQTLFAEVYRKLRDHLSDKLQYDIRTMGIDPHEVEAVYDDVIFDLVTNYQESKGSFAGLFYTRLKSRKIDLLRKHGRIHETVSLDDANVETMSEDFNREHTPTPEEVVIKKRDQRQLISFLATGQSDFTVQVLALLSKCSTPTALAKELGVHHSKVSRALDKLRNRYDANRFGRIQDYLAC